MYTTKAVLRTLISQIATDSKPRKLQQQQLYSSAVEIKIKVQFARFCKAKLKNTE